jgi:diguanylate cyclase (GGDEF)-like protein
MVNTKKRILVVDASRVVRASLAKHLRESFELVEASSSEAASQILAEAPNFAAIISGITPPKVDAYALLERLRSGALATRGLPLVLIVSDLNAYPDKESDLERGIAGFITKSMNKDEIVSCLDALVAASAPAEAPAGRLLEGEEFGTLLAALDLKAGPAKSVCALVFAIDDREFLISRFGQDVAQAVDAMFARLLVAKVGATSDLIGRCRGDRLAIVTHGVDLKQGLRFGKQVCKGLAAGSITVRGQKIKLTASVGIASTSSDAAASGSALFARAEERLEQALTCGGNVAVAESRPHCPLRPAGAIAPEKLGALGLKILPLLQTLDDELALGLPLAEIRKKIEARALSEG